MLTAFLLGTNAISLDDIRKITRLGEDDGLFVVLSSEKASVNSKNSSKKPKKQNQKGQKGKEKEGKEKAHTISLVIPETKLHPNGQTHITVSSGAHEPKCMMDVALAIYNKCDSVTLPIQGNPSQKITYTINRKDASPCKLVYLDVFGI